MNTAFTDWLNGKLVKYNIDEMVFGAYILGILEGDDTYEEKCEALKETLNEILNQETVDNVVKEIVNKWIDSQKNKTEMAIVNKVSSIDLESQLSKLMKSQRLEEIVKERKYTDEEKRVKEQILAQYSQAEISDDYEVTNTDDEIDQHSNVGTLNGVERNTNFQNVIALQKERREQARLETAAKRQKDKDDRERQKQLRNERKEKRKTVKGERRR